VATVLESVAQGVCDEWETLSWVSFVSHFRIDTSTNRPPDEDRTVYLSEQGPFRRLIVNAQMMAELFSLNCIFYMSITGTRFF
jgi:hypothetical protein